ncbi:helix-turn-helix domain-containing protein [Myxococcota bacterium]|nr:helix-turn-helix domain-containing protein [Myxococcota bacterium]
MDLNPQEAAVLSGLSERTLRAMLKDGRLLGRADVAEWLATHRGPRLKHPTAAIIACPSDDCHDICAGELGGVGRNNGSCGTQDKDDRPHARGYLAGKASLSAPGWGQIWLTNRPTDALRSS